MCLSVHLCVCNFLSVQNFVFHRPIPLVTFCTNIYFLLFGFFLRFSISLIAIKYSRFTFSNRACNDCKCHVHSKGTTEGSEIGLQYVSHRRLISGSKGPDWKLSCNILIKSQRLVVVVDVNYWNKERTGLCEPIVLTDQFMLTICTRN